MKGNIFLPHPLQNSPEEYNYLLLFNISITIILSRKRFIFAVRRGEYTVYTLGFNNTIV